MRFVSLLIVVVVGCCVVPAAANTVTYILPEPQPVDTDVHVTLESNFTADDVVFFTTNATYCLRSQALDKHVFRWRPHADRFRWTSPFFHLQRLDPSGAQYVRYVYICHSSDGGDTWQHLFSSPGNQKPIPVLPAMPHAEVGPFTPIEKHNVYITYSVAGLDGYTGFLWWAFLAHRPEDCAWGDRNPAAFIDGGNITQVSAEGATATFAPLMPVSNAYACLSVDNKYSWTATKIATRDSYWAATKPYAENEINSFAIYSEEARNVRAAVDCIPLIAGIDNECIIELFNTSFSRDAEHPPTELYVEELRDGDGTEICPLPSIKLDANVSVGERLFYRFRFFPHESGKGGLLRVRFQGHPLNMYSPHDTVFFELYKRNSSYTPVRVKDDSIAHFYVQPSYVGLDDGHKQNILQVLNDTLHTGTYSISETVRLPVQAHKCHISALVSYNGVLDSSLNINALHTTGSLTSVGSFLIGNRRLMWQKSADATGLLYKDRLQLGIRSWERVGGNVAISPSSSSLAPRTLTITATNTYTNFEMKDVTLTCTGTHPITPRSETLALETIYADLGGTSWRYNRNWLTGDPCGNKWFGVECKNYHVTGLKLSNNLLQGWLPTDDTFAQLPFLEDLEMASNHITGMLGMNTTLQTVPRLRKLDLSFNRVSANATTGGYFLGASRCVREVRLRGNGLEHWVSGGVSQLGHGVERRSLRVLDLSRNDITGTIPDDIQLYTELLDLQLSNNKFEGDIPDGISRTAVSIDLSNNLLNGTFPATFHRQRHFAALQHLDLSHNLLTGELPRNFFIGSTGQKRQTVLLNDNHFIGLLPEWLGTVRGKVDVRDNVWRCPIPQWSLSLNTFINLPETQCDEAAPHTEL